MPLMRAKMLVLEVETQSSFERIKMTAVSASPYGPNGESEDNTYARYTPSGEVSLMITNPDLLGKLKPGQKFYIDFTEASN